MPEKLIEDRARWAPERSRSSPGGASRIGVSHTVEVPPLLSTAEIVTSRLIAAGCVAADDEADELLAAAPDDVTLEAWIRRRERGEPLAWITGTLQFCGHTVHVDPGVYVPRLQSEELASRAASLLAVNSGRAVDLCTGAGAIAVYLGAEAPTATVVGVDIDIRAVLCARRNGVLAIAADLDPPLRSKAFDIVTAVAPYVPTGELGLLPRDVQRYEPRLSLDGGDDGLDLVRKIVLSAARLLRPGGWLLIELGGEQDRALSPTLVHSGFDNAEPWYDEDGDLRGLVAQATGVDLLR
jgi:release factor glutamine methyltransferase